MSGSLFPCNVSECENAGVVEVLADKPGECKVFFLCTYHANHVVHQLYTEGYEVERE